MLMKKKYLLKLIPACIKTVHLYEQLCLESTTGLVFRIRSSTRTQWINFIDENCAGRMESSLQNKDINILSQYSQIINKPFRREVGPASHFLHDT